MDILYLILPYLENKDKLKLSFSKKIIQARNKSFDLFDSRIIYTFDFPFGIWDKLTNLDFTFLTLKYLPILPPHLKVLRCNHNYITRLPELPNLTELNVSYNCLLKLPVLPITLKKLYCSNNYLKTLPVLPELVTLSIQENNFVSLPPIPKSIKLILCSSSQFEKFQFSNHVLII